MNNLQTPTGLIDHAAMRTNDIICVEVDFPKFGANLTETEQELGMDMDAEKEEPNEQNMEATSEHAGNEQQLEGGHPFNIKKFYFVF